MTSKTTTKTKTDAKVDAATEINTSGAPQQIVDGVDMDHPAIDANPRANTSAVQNAIDMNDPSKTGAEAVEEALKSQD